jgi:hypothetical protein
MVGTPTVELNPHLWGALPAPRCYREAIVLRASLADL